MHLKQRAEKLLSLEEQREYKRFAIELPGKLFFPTEEVTIECQISILSGGGAGVRCHEPPPLQSFVVLYIDGFGRFEGVATRFIDAELGLRFVCKEAKRQRLLDDLMNFVNDGLTVPTRLRRQPRVQPVTDGYFTSSNGEHVRCDILDVSLQGTSLRTTGRPPVGEIINLGKTYGRVVRHHCDGIAIEFLKVAKRPPLGN
jgi:hypothetical protein